MSGTFASICKFVSNRLIINYKYIFLKYSTHITLFTIWDAILLRFQTPTMFAFDDVLSLYTFFKLGGIKVEEWGLPSFLVHNCHLIGMNMPNYYHI
jgi:hypothetical protein